MVHVVRMLGMIQDCLGDIAALVADKGLLYLFLRRDDVLGDES